MADLAGHSPFNDCVARCGQQLPTTNSIGGGRDCVMVDHTWLARGWGRGLTSFGRDERCHVSFSSSSSSIIFSLCFIMLYYAFICFHYAFIMLSVCFHDAFLGTRLIKVSFFDDVTYLRTIFQNTKIPLSSRESFCICDFQQRFPTCMIPTTYPQKKRPSKKKGLFLPPQGDFPHKPWCPRHHLSGTHTPPTSTFIPPHPAETTERGPYISENCWSPAFPALLGLFRAHFC